MNRQKILPENQDFKKYPPAMWLAMGGVVVAASLVIATSDRDVYGQQPDIKCVLTNSAAPGTTPSGLVQAAAEAIPGTQTPESAKALADTIPAITEGSKVTICYEASNDRWTATTDTNSNVRTYSSK